MTTPGGRQPGTVARPGFAWLVPLVVAASLGALAAWANVTTLEQMSGLDQGAAAARKSVSRLLSAGVLWAGVAFLAGRLVRRPGLASLAGSASLLTAVIVHYGLAGLAGLMPWTDAADNMLWFVVAIVTGAPLGLLGACSRRVDAWGLLARLALPVGAVLEPFVVGWLPPWPQDIWANRVAATVAGTLLVGAGLVTAVVVVVRWWRGRPARRD